MKKTEKGEEEQQKRDQPEQQKRDIIHLTFELGSFENGQIIF